MTDAPPTLIYDGQCGFCKIWVNYWRLRTGPRIVYAAAQEVAEQYPGISREEFRRSVWLIFPEGAQLSGAQAVFTLIATGIGTTWPLRIYTNVPGVRALSEAAYRVIAAHRDLFYWVTRLLWGKELEPESSGVTRALVLRGLAVVYLVAFASLIPQIRGLIGEHGILPAHDFLEAVRSQFKGNPYAALPTLAWLNSSDVFLLAMAWTGIAMAVALLVGFVPMLAIVSLFVLYLSFDSVGQSFLSFQWDALLLEAGFAAILITPFGVHPAYTKRTLKVGIWVFRFLAFRLMLESGLVKITSGDPSWRALTALQYHYETQPLPTPLAWYAHQLPATVQKISAAGMFGVELLVPFLFLMPRRLRITGAWITIAFQALLALTGNYTFFNLLTIVLCVSLFDDQHLRKFLPLRVSSEPRSPLADRLRPVTIAGGMVLLVLGFGQLLTTAGLLQSLPQPLAALDDEASILHIVNRYGLFAVMTTTRPEIVIEGSEDGLTWSAYEFKFKPGGVNRSLRWVAPYQPRLDWQMWFAALSNYQNNAWFSSLMLHLLQGSPDVLGLLEKNPFPNKPPEYIRAVLYEYRFSSPVVRRETGAIWTRKELGDYFPAVKIRQQ